MPEMAARQVRAARSSLVKVYMDMGSSLKPTMMPRTRVVEETHKADHTPENLPTSIYLAVSLNAILYY